MITTPTRPAAPISRHSKQLTIIESSGAVHIRFKHKLKISNRLTSLDRRFTTLPAAVSPSAVCERRNAFSLCMINKIQLVYFYFSINWLIFTNLSINYTANSHSDFHRIMISIHVSLIRAYCLCSIKK